MRPRVYILSVAGRGRGSPSRPSTGASLHPSTAAANRGGNGIGGDTSADTSVVDGKRTKREAFASPCARPHDLHRAAPGSPQIPRPPRCSTVADEDYMWSSSSFYIPPRLFSALLAPLLDPFPPPPYLPSLLPLSLSPYSTDSLPSPHLPITNLARRRPTSTTALIKTFFVSWRRACYESTGLGIPPYVEASRDFGCCEARLVLGRASGTSSSSAEGLISPLPCWPPRLDLSIEDPLSVLGLRRGMGFGRMSRVPVLVSDAMPALFLSFSFPISLLSTELTMVIGRTGIVVGAVRAYFGRTRVLMLQLACALARARRARLKDSGYGTSALFWSSWGIRDVDRQLSSCMPIGHTSYRARARGAWVKGTNVVRREPARASCGLPAVVCRLSPPTSSIPPILSQTSSTSSPSWRWLLRCILLLPPPSSISLPPSPFCQSPPRPLFVSAHRLLPISYLSSRLFCFPPRVFISSPLIVPSLTHVLRIGVAGEGGTVPHEDASTFGVYDIFPSPLAMEWSLSMDTFSLPRPTYPRSQYQKI
ncbi:hypothetical protein K438DRAFT_1983409 [Mycena galopus ATCC 62051]|nr:hypothetical protein K438DRAFT_1983409 [Mycena galopus ATCC 62051]